MTEFDGNKINSMMSLIGATKSAFKKIQLGELIDVKVTRGEIVLNIKMPAIIVHKKSLNNLLKLSKGEK